MRFLGGLPPFEKTLYVLAILAIFAMAMYAGYRFGVNKDGIWFEPPNYGPIELDRKGEVDATE